MTEPTGGSIRPHQPAGDQVRVKLSDGAWLCPRCEDVLPVESDEEGFRTISEHLRSCRETNADD